MVTNVIGIILAPLSHQGSPLLALYIVYNPYMVAVAIIKWSPSVIHSVGDKWVLPSSL